MKRLTKLGILLLAALALSTAATVEELLNQMDPMLGDGAARIELFQKTREVMTPPVDPAAREAHETALLNGLDLNVDDAIKADVIRELRLVGTEASVARLGELIAGDNETLYVPAMQTLLDIYQSTQDPNVKVVVRTAMASATGGRLATMIKAAGSMQDTDADVQQILLENAANQDWALRGVSLRSLARIGDAGARTVLADALTTAANSYELSKIITWNLLYAKRLAERNLKDSGTEVANDIRTFAENNTLGGCQGSVHAIMCADVALSEIPDIPISVKQIGKETENSPAVKVDKGFKINILAQGAWEISLKDVMGKVLWSRKGSEPGAYRIPKSLVSPGVYAVELKSGDETMIQHVVLH
jgi:hypothetical protein